MDVNLLRELDLKTTHCMTWGPRFPLGIRRMTRALDLGLHRHCLQGSGDGSSGNRMFHALVRVAAFSFPVHRRVVRPSPDITDNEDMSIHL